MQLLRLKSLNLRRKQERTPNYGLNYGEVVLLHRLLMTLFELVARNGWQLHFLNKPVRSKAIKWGLTNEATSLKKYCSLMGKDFYKCGTTIDKQRNHISATPDAVNLTGDTIVEIKCPFSAKDGKPEEVGYLKDGRLKSTHKYYTQVQMQMYVTGIHGCDFVVWTPQGIFIQGIKYDPELVHSFLPHIDFYYRNVFTPLYFKTTCS